MKKLLLLLAMMSQPCLAEMIYDGETALFGEGISWDENGSVLVQAKLAPYSKPKHLRAKIHNVNWWGAVAYVPKNWQTIDVSKFQTLSLYAKSNKPVTLMLQLFDSQQKASSKILQSLTTTYKQITIPVSQFEDVDRTKVTAFVFAVSQNKDIRYVIDIDNIELLGSVEPTPTPDPTPNPTPIPGGGLDFGLDGKLQIHAIGDSITENPGWRTNVYESMTKDGLVTDFIGSTKDQWPQSPEAEHDGHGGYSTWGILDEMGTWYQKIAKPELTIIMIGTNDIAWWIAEPIGDVVNRLNSIIDKARANAPKQHIIVASIPPEGGNGLPLKVPPENRDRQAMLTEYNKGIYDLITKRKATGEQISYVDIYSTLTISDLYDGIHPNDAGHVKMGQAFYGKIKQLIGVNPQPTPTPTPTPTSATMKVNGRHLYDACGQKIVLRGVNHMTCWTDWSGTQRDGLPMFFEIAKTGANVVRIVWIYSEGTTAQELDNAISNAAANKMIPMIENHNQTCEWSRAAFDAVLNWWLKPDIFAVLKKHEKYLLLNFANEMGDWGTTAESFKAEYTRAIGQLRSAGLKMPIVIDSTRCGQDENMILNNAGALIAADPEHNLIFSLHIYWDDMNLQRIQTALNEAKNRNIPFIVGEFASVSTDCKTPILYKDIIRIAQANEIGYLPWSWDDQNYCPAHSMTKDTNQSYDSLWGWAAEVAVTDPNSIKNTSIKSQCF